MININFQLRLIILGRVGSGHEALGQGLGRVGSGHEALGQGRVGSQNVDPRSSLLLNFCGATMGIGDIKFC